MNKVIIFGADQFAELLYEYLNNDNEYEVCAFTVDREYWKNEYFSGCGGIKIVPFDEIEKLYPAAEYAMFIAIGYTQMNAIRQQKFQRAKLKQYKILGYRHPSALILSNDIGEGNIFFENVTIGAKCKIGNGNVFWPNAHIAHHTVVGDFNFFTISVAVAGNIAIHNNCLFGNNCTVRNGIEIADYTLIGAGAYVSKSTSEYDVIVPARSLKLEGKKSTDFNHY